MDIHGLYMFCGSQGSGKTISAIYFIRIMLQKFPLIKVRSNISISFQHGQITHWKQLINVHNGEIGQIDFLDDKPCISMLSGFLLKTSRALALGKS